MRTRALAGWVLGLGPALLSSPAHAQDAELPPIPATAVSQPYPGLTCTGTNAGVNADVLQLAADTRSELAPILNLGPHWRFPVHIDVVMPDDPAAGKIRQERVAVTLAAGTLNLEAALPGNETGAREFIQRQFITALLWEKFFANTTSFDTKTDLAVVPLWLVVGLGEWLSEDNDRSRQEIVRREARIQRAPTLKDIMSWQAISTDRLLGLYQRAFCFYLVNSLIHGEAKRVTFQQWLETFAGPDPASATYLFPTEAAWQQELQDAPERSHDIVYTWDETSTALADAETILVPSRQPGDARICTLDNVLEFPVDTGLKIALPKKIFDLTALELRAHPSWRPILASYRFGLNALMQGQAKQAQKFIQQAQQARVRETEFHSRLTDYVNWFEVTKDFQGVSSPFEGYFSTAKAMEEVQADPAKPNPLRADLIHAESRL
jgi:hypothetical protein